VSVAGGLAELSKVSTTGVVTASYEPAGQVVSGSFALG
jgi:hypothetical protein